MAVIAARHHLRFQVSDFQFSIFNSWQQLSAGMPRPQAVYEREHYTARKTVDRRLSGRRCISIEL